VSAPQSHDDRDDRRCTYCGAPARFVASAGSLSWFECGGHGPTENLAAVIRDRLEPLDLWRARMAAEGQTALRRVGDNELAALVELMTEEP
jgi:hypothetical protein